MLSKNLTNWIAESQSWQAFIDYNLPEDTRANYHFLNRKDDFYISLLGNALKILKGDLQDEQSKSDILFIAKGLEIYSLEKKRDFFSGVNFAQNILFVGTLYYLADYQASALLLSKLFKIEDFSLEIEKFAFQFLSRKLDKSNEYSELLHLYLGSGNEPTLNKLTEKLKNDQQVMFYNQPLEYSYFKVVNALILTFQKQSIWSDLKKQNDKVDFWEPFVRSNLKKRIPIWTFFPSQRSAIENKILDQDYRAISLQMPTSSGKTSLSELLIYNESKSNPHSKVLYLAPYRALASELKNSLAKNVKKWGIKAKVLYGGNTPDQQEVEYIQQASLLISTPEKFMAIERVINNISDDYSLIICDEGHLIDDRNRGLSYELLLSRLKTKTEKRFIFLSAIIPNIQIINNWLGGTDKTVIKSNYRPTQIEYSILKPIKKNPKNFYLDVNPTKEQPTNYQLYKILVSEDFQYINADTGRKNTHGYKNSHALKSIGLALKSIGSGSVAIFTPHKRGNTGVESIVKKAVELLETKTPLSKSLEYANKEKVSDLKDYFKIVFGNSFLLTKIISYGIVFHHADLPQDIREIIENVVREEEIKLIICTNTIAEGVNLPIKTLVIHSARRYEDNEWQPLKLRDIKNLVGRTGRAGKETKGMVIVTKPDDFQYLEPLVKENSVEEVKGDFYNKISQITKVITQRRITLSNDLLEQLNDIDAIDTAIIDLLAEEIEVENLESEIQSLMHETLAFYQAKENEKKVLSKILHFRGEEISNQIRNDQFKYIKKSGLTLRNYKILLPKLDLKNKIWEEIETPYAETWLKFVYDITKEPIDKSITNEKHREQLDSIPNLIKQWINGSWYDQMARITDLEISKFLNFFNSVIQFHFHNLISNIIRAVELKLEDTNKNISLTILDFPKYLEYGLKEKFQLDLFSIGLNDRITLIELQAYHSKDKIFVYDSLNELKKKLINNSDELKKYLNKQLPTISLKRFNRFLDQLSHNF